MKQAMEEIIAEDTMGIMTENMKEVKQVEAKYLEAMEKEASDGSGTKGTHGVKLKNFGRRIELADAMK